MTNMKELPPFYVGQEVVCIKNHSDLLVVKNNIYIIKGLKQCRCGLWLVSVGVIAPRGIIHSKCRAWVSNRNEEAFLAPYLFAPITNNFKEISYFEVLELEKPLVSAN